MDFDFLGTKSSYHCENQPLLGSDFLRTVYIPFQYSIWDFACCNIWRWVMMIKSSLRLIFVLVYKSTFLLSESEKRKHVRGCFVLFNKLLILPRFNWCFFFLLRNFPVIRENGDYFTVVIGLFKVFVWLKYWKVSVT